MEEIKLKGLNETIYYEKLNNGLRVYMWVKKSLNTFYGTLSVKYGSVFNTFKIGNKTYTIPKGVAHFLEHVKFNEDKGVTAHEYYNAHGCDTNAFTTFNYTNYQVLGSDNPTQNVLHLLDFVQKGYFTKSIISNEKGIIMEEAKMGTDDPYTTSLFKHLENIFHNYEQQYIITGTPEDIKEITLDDIKLVFDTYYHPENMFLIVTGNFNPYEMLQKIKENQESKEFPKYASPERFIPKEPKKVKKAYDEVMVNVTSRKIKFGIKMPLSNFKDMDLFHIRLYLNLILKANFGVTSDFRDNLLEKELISGLSYFVEYFDDYVIIMLTVDSPYTDEIIKLVNKKFDNLEMDEKTFNRMKNANIASLILDYEDVETVNSLLQDEILNYGDVVPNVKELYENTTYEEVINFMHNLNLKERAILILNPME